MELIKDTIQQVMEQMKTKKKISRSDKMGILVRRVLTKKEKEHVKFDYFNKGVLSLLVDSSTWLYHLSLQKEKLLSKLNKKSNAVKDIRFHIGKAQ